MVNVAPEPLVSILPGVRIKVHGEGVGKPLKSTLPVVTVHVGCVIAPTIGGEGGKGWGLMVKLADAAEVHPEAFVTVTVYVLGAMPDIVVVVPVPEAVTPAGVLVTVQVPVAGKPFNVTLPVATEHVGWIIVPITGGVGVIGVLILTFADGAELHPSSFVTIKL
jgi:hypothetical protein